MNVIDIHGCSPKIRYNQVPKKAYGTVDRSFQYENPTDTKASDLNGTLALKSSLKQKDNRKLNLGQVE